MSTKTKKQSFLQDATAELENLALDFGVEGSDLETLGNLATKLLKESFKNGLKAAYRTRLPAGRKQAKESKEKAAEY